MNAFLKACVWTLILCLGVYLAYVVAIIFYFYVMLGVFNYD